MVSLVNNKNVEPISYLRLPVPFVTNSDEYFCLNAIGGQHFKSFGIRDGSLLVFKIGTEQIDGHPSCYAKYNGDKIVIFKLSKKDVHGYKHLGRLVSCLTKWDYAY